MTKRMPLKCTQRRESEALLEALNRVYEGISPTREEKEIRRLMKQKQREMVKGEWYRDQGAVAEKLQRRPLSHDPVSTTLP